MRNSGPTVTPEISALLLDYVYASFWVAVACSVTVGCVEVLSNRVLLLIARSFGPGRVMKLSCESSDTQSTVTLGGLRVRNSEITI